LQQDGPHDTLRLMVTWLGMHGAEIFPRI
jgi:hypothetical protein